MAQNEVNKMFKSAALTVLVALGLFLQWSNKDTDQFAACSMPVLEYTTGELDQIDEHLYSDSVEWVVQDIHAYPSTAGLPVPHEGWIVLIRMIADGDDALEDYTVREDGLAQIKVNGTWMLQADFERQLCGVTA
ncbi:MAG: hypothetical protein ACI9H6_000246 [Patiriisocius sp.]